MTGGAGITIPIADDSKLLSGNRELLRVQNEAVHVLPFLGIVNRYDRHTYLQAYTQLDVDVNGNPVLANLSGGPLQQIGRFTDSTLLHLDTSLHRIVYETRNPSTQLKRVIANAELHYTGTLQGTDTVSGAGLSVSNLKRNFNILNATFGAHMMVGKNLIITPGMSIPLRSGLDEQFDYEAILQVTHLQ